MGKCLSIPPPEEQIEMKVIEETSDIISMSVEEIEEIEISIQNEDEMDSIRSLDIEEYLEIDRVVNEILEEEEQSNIERWVDEILEQN